MKTYPRLTVRRNARGWFDAYLVRAVDTPEMYVSTGPTIAGALWWVRPSVSRCCLAAA